MLIFFLILEVNITNVIGVLPVYVKNEAIGFLE